MSVMELATGSLVALIAFNPTNIGVYIPMLVLSVIGYLYIE